MKVKRVVTQKAWWQSKTNWVALITIALGILGLLENFMQQIESKYLYIVIAVIGILGLVLRRLTNKPVGMTEVSDIIKKTKKARAAAEERSAEPPEPEKAIKLKVVDLEESKAEKDEEPHALGDIQDKEEEPPTEKDELDQMMDDIDNKTLKKNK